MKGYIEGDKEQRNLLLRQHGRVSMRGVGVIQGGDQSVPDPYQDVPGPHDGRVCTAAPAPERPEMVAEPDACPPSMSQDSKRSAIPICLYPLSMRVDRHWLVVYGAIIHRGRR